MEMDHLETLDGGLEVLNFPPSHLVVLRGSRQGIRLAGPKPV